MSASVWAPPVSPSARRPWLLLGPVALGLALYLVGYVLRYAPEALPRGMMMPAMMGAMWGPMLSVLALGLFWLIFGWSSFSVRLVSLLLLAAVGTALVFAAEKDTRFWLIIWGIPGAVAVLTVTLVLLFPAPAGVRSTVATLLTLAAVLPWEVIRIEGVTGDFSMDPVWRWTPTAEERVAAFTEGEPTAQQGKIPAVMKAGEGDWPGFRGPNRDGRFDTPVAAERVEVWRRPVGPGWGSVSGVGDRLFTQEQRGAEEVVACYELKTGKTLWTHGEEARHNDGPSGPGPRATPTFHDGRLYVQGATGVLLCLDAATGRPEWKADLKELLGISNPVFGFSGSPLVVNDTVYVHPGVKGAVLVALDARTGKQRWQAGEQETESYSSPQLARLAGEDQIVVFGANGLSGHDPLTGQELWQYEWKSDPTAQPCVQPTLLPGDRIVVGAAQPGLGMRCVKVTKQQGKWSASPEWETTRVTPRFNDIVHQDGNLYGLDGGRLFCVDAGNGELRWKGRSALYGAGQVLLVGDRLLVQAERGFLAWFDPDPKAAPQPGRVEAMADKTWNHPAVVRGWLILRNGKEMVGFGPKE